MEKIRIKCPICGAILEVVDNPANYEKNVVCPNCKSKNKWKEFKRVVYKPAAPTPEEDSTHIELKTKDAIGYLLELSSSRQYSLKEGKNLIGRRTYKSQSPADIPIETTDMGMSRRHMYIDVMRGRDGYYHAYAYNANNQNDTLINGVRLEDDDKIGLKHGDIITLCETRIKYVRNTVSENSERTPFDDETQL